MGDKLNTFLEWLAVAWLGTYMWCFVFYHLITIIIICFYPYSAVIFISYILWAYYDRRAGSMRNRKLDCFRDWRLWKYIRNYFPVKLIKTAELPESKNYILAGHHHGVLPLSTVCNFASEANDIGKLFPGIDFRIAVRGFVHCPITREVALSLGMVDISEFTITRLLERNIPTGIFLFPGGGKEFAITTVGSNKFEIYTRKGFVRVALKTGASLVPVLVFGDTELYQKKLACPNFFKWLPNTFTLKRQMVSLYPNNLHLFQFLPKKIPLNTIVGAPIAVPKTDNPPPDLIDHYYTKFYEAFKQLFETYKNDFSPVGSSYELIIT